MNIEDLTKTQLLLLTIMVNFVTSIATGVLTVSLLDQAPPTVIQTVNRIVDHTIETVTTEVPVVRNTPSSAPSSEELLTAAVAKAAARTVRIYRSGVADPVGYGIYVPGSRSVFAWGDMPGTIRVAFPDGTEAQAEEAKSDGDAHRYVLAADVAAPSVPDARLVEAGNVKQAQTVIALDAAGNAVTGIVSRVDELVYTDLPGIPSGAAAVNLSGDVIGMSLGDGRFLPGGALAALIAP